MNSKPLKLWANPEDLKKLRNKTGHVILLTREHRGGGPMATTQPIYLHELRTPNTTTHARKRKKA